MATCLGSLHLESSATMKKAGSDHGLALAHSAKPNCRDFHGGPPPGKGADRISRLDSAGLIGERCRQNARQEASWERPAAQPQAPRIGTVDGPVRFERRHTPPKTSHARSVGDEEER